MKTLSFVLFLISIVAFSQDNHIKKTDSGLVRMGIVGMTHDHVYAILNNPTHEGMLLVGFAEPNKDLAMRRLKKANLPDSLWFPSLEELIAKTKPDAVCDFRSTFEHLETVEKCAVKGIHVMVEKPLAVNLEHAKKMEALAKKHRIQLITNYETTWYTSHHKAFDLINNEGRIGEIRKVVIMDGHSGPKEIGCSNEFLEWLTDPIKNGGGAIMDFGCYGADIMTWLLKGERPISVTANSHTNKPAVYPKVDDEATIVVQYPKAQGIFQASWNWPFDRKDTEIYGQKGYIFANKNPQMLLKAGERWDAKEEKIELSLLKSPQNDAFSYFAGVVRGNINSENDLGSLRINMVAMEILDAAVKSAKTHKTVFLK
jgi:predicted dehydrogenase